MTAEVGSEHLQNAASSAPIMIQAEGLTKHYGDFMAIEKVTFSVNRGEVLGFLGANAAGKTTTMRILSGSMAPTEGVARIAGFDTVEQSREARRCVGYMPESVSLYNDMTIEGYLEYMGTLRSMDRRRLRRRIYDTMDLVQVSDYRHSLISRLSKGYRQRVGLAQAILHEPPVLIMDEPTIGIDPGQVVEIRQLIRQLGGTHTILLSTHILPEVSMTCSRVIIIHEGRIVADGTLQQLGQQLQGVERIDLDVRGPTTQVTTALQGLAGVLKVNADGDGPITCYNVLAQRGMVMREDVARLVVMNGWDLMRLQAVDMALEDIFLKVTTQES